ncbi:MAG TPA: hypothetical protein VI932_01055 [Bacteroidota bacterium]|nr:hypothetical protein [Bacteroidota bacterium]
MSISRSPSPRLLLAAILSTAIVSMFLWIGCDQPQDTPNAGVPDQHAQVLDKENPQVRLVMDLQDRHTDDLMSVPGVVGTATGLAPDGRIAILVYLKEAPKVPVKGIGISAAGIPLEIDGVPVVTEVTGEFHAMAGGSGVSHKAKQTPPIQLGTSGGWRYDLANGYCCGGTLGSLINKGGAQYVLSNYHVFWADIVNGGNGRVATAGDPVVQPGLIDVGCVAANAQNVATLSGSGSLPGANVDAGYAQVISGMVRTDGAILEVGTISATTQAAALNQAVKKSGRTTGLSRSKVSGLNATVSIAYDNECAGGAAFTKTFTGQIVIANRGSKFLAGGDSGSLMVQDVTTNPRAVGLLYAGSFTSAIANPINAVLSWAGATMVGN